MDEGNGIKPRVFYIGLPKRFIAGALYDEAQDECTEGVKVTAICAETKKEAGSAVTDSYGDFWIRNLENGIYNLICEKDGKKLEIGPVDVTERDINVGDFAF